MITTPVVSTVPAVLDELVNRLQTVVFLGTDVQVTDGQPIPPQDQSEDLISIGYTGQEGEPSVDKTDSVEQLDLKPGRESYDITCLASSWKGQEGDASAVRSRTYELITLVRDEITRDPTLGGRCGRTRLTTGAMAQEITTMGAVCTVRFVIHVDAFTGR